MEARQASAGNEQVDRILARLGTRSIVLVGMMGAGKTSIGRRVANALHLPFVDADAEIEKAANQTIAEIFAEYGEAYFRDGERRVVARLLSEGPQVVATGGGAFISEETRQRCRERAVTIWLKAEVSVLLERVRKKGNRPLLQGADPEGVLRRLLAERERFYGMADLCIASREGPHHALVGEILAALESFLSESQKP